MKKEHRFIANPHANFELVQVQRGREGALLTTFAPIIAWKWRKADNAWCAVCPTMAAEVELNASPHDIASLWGISTLHDTTRDSYLLGGEWLEELQFMESITRANARATPLCSVGDDGAPF